MKKCLLLNSSYEYLEIISMRKAIKHIINGKVEIIDLWDQHDRFSPAILRLKHYVRPHVKRVKCTRETLFKRDGYRCMYCGHAPANYKELEMDHIIPSSLGGKTSFQNCVTSCRACNLHKGNKNLNQVGFKLLREPKVPKFSFEFLVKSEFYFPAWDHYLPK